MYSFTPLATYLVPLAALTIVFIVLAVPLAVLIASFADLTAFADYYTVLASFKLLEILEPYLAVSVAIFMVVFAAFALFRATYFVALAVFTNYRDAFAVPPAQCATPRVATSRASQPIAHLIRLLSFYFAPTAIS